MSDHRRPSFPHHHATPFSIWRLLLTALFCVLTGVSQAATELQVPYIGEPADRSLSPLQEAELGREVMRQLLSSSYVMEDPELSEYINALGQRLLRHTNEQDISFHFFMVRDQAINAFALPGGYIGINAGLLMASESESELAGVVAHEIAHVTQRHIARSLDQGSDWDIASAALLLAALIAGAHDPEMAQAALTLGMSAAAQHQINFTRANELEADRLGIRTLAAAGLDPAGMGSFFHRLSQKAQLYGQQIPEILRTHPVSTTRIAEAQGRAAELPKVSVQSSLDYQLMRERARVLTTELASESLAHYRASQSAQADPGSRYGLALSLYRARQFDAAEKLIQDLIKDHPEQLNLELALGRIHIDSGDLKRGFNRLQAIYKDHPDSRSATLTLADGLIRAGQPDNARQLLLESSLLLQDDAETHRLLAMAARDMGERAEAHYQMATYSRARGDYVAAIRQLSNGLRLDDLSPHDQRRLQGRLEQYSAEAPESERKRARREQREPVNR